MIYELLLHFGEEVVVWGCANRELKQMLDESEAAILDEQEQIIWNSSTTKFVHLQMFYIIAQHVEMHVHVTKAVELTSFTYSHNLINQASLKKE